MLSTHGKIVAVAAASVLFESFGEDSGSGWPDLNFVGSRAATP